MSDFSHIQCISTVGGRDIHKVCENKDTHRREIRERSFWYFMRHMLRSDHRKGMRSIPWDLKNISEWRIKSHLRKCTAVAFIVPDPSHIASPFMGSQKTEMSSFRSVFCEHICASYITDTVYTALYFMNEFYIHSNAKIFIISAFKSYSIKIN